MRITIEEVSFDQLDEKEMRKQLNVNAKQIAYNLKSTFFSKLTNLFSTLSCRNTMIWSGY